MRHQIACKRGRSLPGMGMVREIVAEKERVFLTPSEWRGGGDGGEKNKGSGKEWEERMEGKL